jgi:8-oxo-dGTP diphosphatase
VIRESANIIIINDNGHILLHLRDDKPTIAYPNMWVLPGGYIEEHESPEQCIIREIKEELGIELQKVSLFVTATRSYGIEHTFAANANFDSAAIHLTEGQAIRWFSLEDARNTQLGYEDNQILDDFFKWQP